MEFPFGHHKHQQREEEEDEFPPPSHHYQPNRPPPDFPDAHQQYPVTHLHHNLPEEIYNENRHQRPPPTQPGFNHPSFPHESPNYPPPQQHSQHRFDSDPGYPSVQHVSHEPNQGWKPEPFSEPGYSSVQHVSHEPNQGWNPEPSEIPHETHHRPHLPSFVHHRTHEGSELSGKPTVRVFCKAKTDFSLTIRDGKVILARSDEKDDFQHWIKDEKYSTRVKDEEGFPSFALINKATGQAMKHSIGATHPVQLIPYNSNALDESVLWAESKDLGDGFRTLRMVNNIRLNLDAFNGDKNHGGVHDGTTIVLWEWKKGENQRWKIVPY